MEGEQGHASELEVFKMLGRCVKETFLEYLPPHSYIKHGGGTKRKYDSVVGPRPRPLRPQGGSEPRIRKRTKITLPPVRDASPFTTPRPASSSPPPDANPRKAVLKSHFDLQHSPLPSSRRMKMDTNHQCSADTPLGPMLITPNLHC